MKCLAFGAIKAPLVLALPVGAEFQTRRPITHEAAQWADSQGYFPCWVMEKWPVFMATGNLCDLPSRYRPGEICYVGVPHWRRGARTDEHGSDADPHVWDSYTRLFRWHGKYHGCLRTRMDRSTDDLVRSDYRRMPGRYLPAWAATAWVLVLGARPERLQDISEADAVAELVEGNAPFPGAPVMWREYPYEARTRRTARDSYRTMIDAVDGPGTWERNPWMWRYVLRRVERPAAAGQGRAGT